VVKLGLMPSYRGPASATAEYTAGLAQVLEAMGAESIWAAEHVIVPADYTSRYPYAEGGRMPLGGDDPIPDPLDWLAFVASASTRLMLGTAVLILPEHNPVILAKRLATIDALSGGRMLAGIGIGWLREEYEAVGVPFGQRGARTDEYVAAMRALWSADVASFEGAFVRFRDVKCQPRPTRPGGVPIIVGGHSPHAARRAGRLGDGFYPLGVSAEQLVELLEIMGGAARAAGRDPAGIEVMTHGPRDLDEAKRLVDLGVSRLLVSARPGDGPDEVRQMLDRYHERILQHVSWEPLA
jgi:probable F420-dependent oxidoreductase